MAEESFHVSVRLSSVERSKLLCRLDEAPSTGVGRDRRRHRRWEFRLSDIAVLVQHPGGGTGRYLVCARNISAGGVSFIHGGYVHPGSECKIVLPKRDGRPIAVTGLVVHCRHVQGVYHEIGVHFAQEIDPAMLLTDEDNTEVVEDRPKEMPTLEGRILVVDQSRAERRLMTHHLGVTGLAMTMVDTPGAAIDAIRKRSYEAMLCDLNIEADAAGMIEAVRAADFKGTIIVVTAETSPQRLAEARSAGANEIIGKPYDPVYLATLLAEWLKAPVVENPIFSNKEQQPGMAEMIADFVNDTQKKAGLLEAAMEREGRPGIRQMCLDLVGSGSGFGFDAVTEAARDALAAIDSAADPTDADPPLKRLIAICTRLRCANASLPPKQWKNIA